MLNGLKTNFQIPNNEALQSYGIAIAEIGIRSAVIRGLVKKANLQNVKIHDASNTPYVIQGGTVADVSNPQFVSKLGTIVYSNIIFNAGKQIEGSIVVNEWGDFRIDDCLIQVSQSKKIVTTEIQGRDGTVKEYIGLDDFNISVTGRLSGDYGVNPKELTKQLKVIFSTGQPLAVSCWWLQNLDITDIVIKDFNFEQNEGEYSTQYFTFSAMSDFPIEARITG